MDEQNQTPATDPFHESSDSPISGGYEAPPESGSTAFSPPPFGTQPEYYTQEYPKGLAIASLVMGILSMLGFITFTFVIPLIFPILGVVFGAVYKSKHYPVGKGISTAGIVLSILSVVLCIAAVAALFAAIPSMMEYIREVDPVAYEQFRQQFEAAGYYY
ncbi:MAG: DUF4190 domain-containing protein [Ruminococcus sp.]|jgi:hypothetical protein|nr:DUF4190 domain-containing protein [Ruminococcus sp.]